MDLHIIIIYFFADEILKAFHLYDDPQVKMNNAEVIAFALITQLVPYLPLRLSERYKIQDFRRTAGLKTWGRRKAQ